jgi:Domain of unknown function (DUF4398)
MMIRRWASVVLGSALVSPLGCGNALYAVRVTQASAELERAEQLDAAHRAPYEYFYALEHLKKARSEAVEADYADAAALAETAYHYAERAIQLAGRVAPAVTVPEPGNP